MTFKFPAIDTTDRGDGKALVWDDADQVHKYEAIAGVTSSVSINEVMNWPAIEQSSDNAQPEWWEEGDANATITDVDIAGESITETWERALKVVTIAADKYAYQRYTYADQPRIKSGRTVSCRVAVWSVSSAAARVSLVSSVGELGVSSDTTSAAWTILTVEGEVLDGTYVEMRFEVDSGTAYFVPLAFGVGDTAPNELPPRGLRQRMAFGETDPTNLRSLTGSTGEASYQTQDLTSSAGPLAAVAIIRIDFSDATGAWWYKARPVGDTGDGGSTERARLINDNVEAAVSQFEIMLSDTQAFEDKAQRTAGSDPLDFGAVYLDGWREWA